MQIRKEKSRYKGSMKRGQKKRERNTEEARIYSTQLEAEMQFKTRGQLDKYQVSEYFSCQASKF